MTLLNYIGLYAMVALGLVLLTGVGGLTSFGQAAFVGLGAYTTAALTTATDLPGWLAGAGASPWLTLLVGLALTAVVAVLIGSLTLKLSVHFLPLGTIAWGISLHFLFGTMQELGGHAGISGIPAIGLAVRAHAALREPDPVRRAHRHRVPLHGGGRRRRLRVGG